jgi:hypothetical protein
LCKGRGTLSNWQRKNLLPCGARIVVLMLSLNVINKTWKKPLLGLFPRL